MASAKTRLPSRLERRRRARRITIITAASLLLIVVTQPLWGGWLARVFADQLVDWSDGFRMKHTEITGNHIVKTEDIAHLADVSKGVMLFQVPILAAQRRIESHPWIKRAIVRRRLPDTIEIQVVEREPAAAVRSERLLMITADSIALAPDSDDWVWDFPLLTPPHPVKIAVGRAVTDTSILALLGEALKLRAVSKSAWHNLS